MYAAVRWKVSTGLQIFTLTAVRWKVSTGLQIFSLTAVRISGPSLCSFDLSFWWLRLTASPETDTAHMRAMCQYMQCLH